MQIGLFGGTFDPIHYGHLRSIEEIRERFALKRVWFIPTSVPPHKQEKEILPFVHRFEMVLRALKDNDVMVASDIEAKKSGTSYSIETIRHFRECSSTSSLFFILGIDAFSEITTWKDYQEAISICNFIITTRPGFNEEEFIKFLPLEISGQFCYNSVKKGYKHPSGTHLFFENITGLFISASEIRKLVKEGKSIKYLLPGEVEEYIREKGLYR